MTTTSIDSSWKFGSPARLPTPFMNGTDMEVLRSCYGQIRTRAGWKGDAQPDVAELDASTGWHEAAFCHAFDFGDGVAISPSGGAWAQNPYFCTGLVAACESVNQLAGRAGPHQVYPKPSKPEITFGTINEDLRRRDFTVNAMALSLHPASRGPWRFD